MFEEFRIGDLPESLQREILDRLAHYSIGFFTVDPSPRGLVYHPKGSGTLVTSKTRNGTKVYAALTAGHVVECLPKEGQLCLALGKGSVPSAELASEDFQSHLFTRGEVPSQGPDLGVIVFAPNVAEALRARKSFVDLDRTLELLNSNEPDIKEGVWATQGFLAERSSSETNGAGELHISMYNFTGFGGAESKCMRGEFDYIDSPITHAEDVPSKFNGMSGGGLWQVPLQKAQDSGIITVQEPIFSGVLFYQESINANESVIRCHGRKSCYQVALDWLKCLP